MTSKPTIDPSQLIANADRLTSITGTWPSFHDAEVQSLSLDREGPTLFVRIFCFELDRSETDSSGCFKRSAHCLVTFRFSRVEDLRADGFNHQNVLSSILFNEAAGGLQVTLEGIFGLTATFRCSEASVEEVIRYQDLRKSGKPKQVKIPPV